MPAVSGKYSDQRQRRWHSDTEVHAARRARKSHRRKGCQSWRPSLRTRRMLQICSTYHDRGTAMTSALQVQLSYHPNGMFGTCWCSLVSQRIYIVDVCAETKAPNAAAVMHGRGRPHQGSSIVGPLLPTLYLQQSGRTLTNKLCQNTHAGSRVGTAQLDAINWLHWKCMETEQSQCCSLEHVRRQFSWSFLAQAHQSWILSEIEVCRPIRAVPYLGPVSRLSTRAHQLRTPWIAWRGAPWQGGRNAHFERLVCVVFRLCHSAARRLPCEGRGEPARNRHVG